MTLNDRVLGWLAENPGYHRPVKISEALGLPTHTVAKTCLRLATNGRAARIRRAGQPQSVYAHPDYA